MSDKKAEFKKEVMSLINTFMNAFDTSGNSAKLCNSLYGSLSPDAFEKEMKNMLSNPKKHVTPQVQAFHKNSQPKLETLGKIAKLVDVELEEYVVMPYFNENTSIDKPTVTATKVPVGPLHLKRLQQLVRKKNKIALSIDQRDARNGQVRNDDKGGRITDPDMYMLSALGAKAVLKEFYGPRADSMKAKEALYNAIRKGERLPRLEDLPNELSDKIALNTLNYYILGATLVTDLLTNSYMLPITQEELVKRGTVNGAKVIKR